MFTSTINGSPYIADFQISNMKISLHAIIYRTPSIGPGSAPPRGLLDSEISGRAFANKVSSPKFIDCFQTNTVAYVHMCIVKKLTPPII